jgi:D-alanine-D-alanine ligase
MKIGITYNLRREEVAGSGLPVDDDEEFDSPDTIDAIGRVLETAGHQAVKLGYGRDFVAALLDDPPDLVFNIAEGVSGRSRESQIPALLEMFSIPYTGSDPLALGLTLDKDLAKRVAASHGLATPRHLVANDLPAFRRLPFEALSFPLIVKPAHEGSSKGIRLQSRVVDSAELEKQAAWLFDRYSGPVMVEEFLEGSEFTVGVIGNCPPRPLGVMMIRHRFLPPEDFIYSLEVKRDWENQVEYLSPPPVPDSLIAEISDLATGVYSALGCRDVARVDIRLRDGRPHFIEVNPLPGLSPLYGDLVIMARKRGVTYDELILEILRHARERAGI